MIQRSSARTSSQKAKLTAADDTSFLVELLLSRAKFDPDAFMRDGLDSSSLSHSKRKSPDSELASPLDVLAPGSGTNALPMSATSDSPSWMPVAIGRRKRITGGLRAPYARKVSQNCRISVVPRLLSVATYQILPLGRLRLTVRTMHLFQCHLQRSLTAISWRLLVYVFQVQHLQQRICV